jgi:type 1 glutamine amidotransferase/HEAT repeat protein
MKAMRNSVKCLAVLAVAALAVGAMITQTLQAAEEAPAPEEIAKITAAAPDHARVKPLKPRKLLVCSFVQPGGYVHSSIPYGKKAIEIMSKKTGAFEAVFSDDVSAFEPQYLEQFDAVLFNNANNELFLPPDLDKLSPAEKEKALERDKRLKDSLVRFLRQGKGMAALHASVAIFREWPEFGDIIGGRFDNHPWVSGTRVVYKVEDPGYPLSKAFPGPSLEIRDEVYQIADPYSRDRQRVILSIDTAKTNMNVQGLHRKDNDYAISWVKRYGQGRVFFSAIGHEHELFWNPVVLRHFLDGIQFALGDLEADTTPSNDPFEKLPVYEFGQDRSALAVLDEILTGATPAERPRLESRLLTAFLIPGATFPARQYICQKLSLIGGDRTVGVLAPFLGNEQLSDSVRFALERISTPKAEKALYDALRKRRLRGKLLAGVINSLAVKGDEKAVSEIGRHVEDPDPVVCEAALSALGRIGGNKAAKILAKAGVPVTLEGARLEARLLCAEKTLAGGDARKAIETFEELSSPDRPSYVRTAAYGNLIKADEARQVEILLGLARSSGAVERAAAARFLSLAPGVDATRAVASQLATLPPETQAILLPALEDRRDKAAGRDVAALAVSTKDAQVRAAALSALGTLGDAQDVALLASEAAKGGETGKTATDSLRRITGKDVDSAILKRTESAAPEERAILIGTLVARGCGEAVPVFLKAADDPDARVCKEAWKGLAELAGEKDLPALMALLRRPLDAAGAEGLERTLSAVARKDKGLEAVKSALMRVMVDSSIQPNPTEFRLFSVFGVGEALDVLKKATASKDTALCDAAVRALADWPDARPAAAVLEIARKSPSEVHRVLALRGYLRMIALPSDRPGAETRAMLKAALAAARRPEDKTMVQNLLNQVEVTGLKAASGKEYKAVPGGLKAGAKCSIDRNLAFTRVPQELEGATYIQTAMDDKNGTEKEFLTFQVSGPVKVYVGYDSRCVNPPVWLGGWKKTTMVLRIAAPGPALNVYGKDFPAGAIVLGGNAAPGAAAMYSVAVKPAAEESGKKESKKK